MSALPLLLERRAPHGVDRLQPVDLLAHGVAAGEARPGLELGIAERRRAEARARARRVQLEEPAPDVRAAFRQLGARELGLRARIAAPGGLAQVLAQRRAIRLRLTEPPVVAREGDQGVADPGKKFARSPAKASTCWRIQPKRRISATALAAEYGNGLPSRSNLSSQPATSAAEASSASAFSSST
jgi:hypothetical protein